MIGDWTLFSNHGHVLVCLARNREARLRDVARDVGITERAVQKIVRELQLAGFISIAKHGRCNRYTINARKNMRHELEAQCSVGRLMQLFTRPERRDDKPADSQDVTAKQVKEKPQSPRVAAKRAPKTQPPLVKAEQSVPPEPRQKASGKNRKAAEPDEPADPREQGSLF